ncbi:MAG TPA: hypothetical protein VJ853_12700 [Thermoanaerobaculia bacterium]|nr:hypothetical protein [Thermoanaerobaculia bacterium]
MIGALLLAATVTLDVKDAKVRDVLKSMQKQCAVKNLIVDPDVPEGSASFYFHEVPCKTAFDVVLATYKLKSIEYSTSTVAVERNR